MNNSNNKVTDMHFHVGLIGDQFPNWGKMSEWYRKQIVYKTFLFFNRIKEDDVSDQKLREETIKTIETSEKVDKVVCLALDPVYDEYGNRNEGFSHVWVDNDYILDLKKEVGDKILLGASIHPYDPNFRERVDKYIDLGAVLIKWLPSAQQINLADNRIKDALDYLATAKSGKPLPLLLHVGAEYAIPSFNPQTASYDYLCWTFWDKVHNFLRKDKLYKPEINKILENLRSGLNTGAVIIFAHCGLPYFAPNIFKRFLEHSDFNIVRNYLEEFQSITPSKGICYADVSALVTPFRKSYFSKIKRLPETNILFGSDFPTPVFELSADLKENWEDFKAILNGHLDRIIVPEDNLLDVNYTELNHFFKDHPMFTNFLNLSNI